VVVKVARFTVGGSTRLGVVEGDEVIDVGSLAPDLPTDVAGLLAGPGLAVLPPLCGAARRLPLRSVRLEAPIVRPPEFLAIGLNYALHVAESGKERPERPVVFNKQATCVTGPFDPVHIPTDAPSMVDYEGELGLVIGRACRGVPAEHALDVVAGYLVVNDVSVRDWQRATPTMTMGKSWDTHGPIGPWLVTADEVPDPQDLRIRTWVDDELRQDESTGQMLTDCRALIAHLSTAFTLLPGTIIATGTPAGVGMGMTPPGFLRAGQTVRIEIDRIGTIENPMIAQPVSTSFW
jgi:2-keto-4-pentenoate hydratase/2-oxohepta-3-ene-1,7-dioic acid hydratase in catechol pathway